jgi:hypothetical protein
MKLSPQSKSSIIWWGSLRQLTLGDETIPMIGVSCDQALLAQTRRSMAPGGAYAPTWTVSRRRRGPRRRGVHSPSERAVAARPRGPVPLPCGPRLPMLTTTPGPGPIRSHLIWWSPGVFQFLCQASFPWRRPGWNRRPIFFKFFFWLLLRIVPSAE